MSNENDTSKITDCPFYNCLSKKIDNTNHCINDNCLHRNNCLQPIGKIECPICTHVVECYMQPICKHFLCASCITKTYYVDDIEEMPRCLSQILSKNLSEKDIIDEIKQFNYDMNIKTALIKEMRECPVCIR